MQTIFDIVYHSLVFLSQMSGFTYEEINIIVYYGVFPLLICGLLDQRYKIHRFKVVALVLLGATLLIIKDFAVFSNWLFDQSVVFLYSFGGTLESYVVASVVICVLLPMFVVLFLLGRILNHSTRRLS